MGILPKPGFLKDSQVFYWIINLLCVLLLLLAMIGKVLKSFSRFAKKSFMSPDFIAQSLIYSPHKSSVGGFGSTVGLHEHTVRDSVSVSKDELRLLYTIPESMCDSVLPSGDADKERVRFLSLGGMLALCDEVTTYLLLAIDKTHRPGQSVQLSGELCFVNSKTTTSPSPTITGGDSSKENSNSNSNSLSKELPDSTMGGKLLAGQTILCVANCSKIGENLSFTSMRIYSYQQKENRANETTDAKAIADSSDDNTTANSVSNKNITSKINLTKCTLLANTRHIKFMKMGFLWDSVIGDCLPLIIHQYKKWRPSHFFIKNFASSSVGEDDKSSGKSGLSNANKLLDTITLERSITKHSSFILKTNPTFLNPLGKIHGGAIAMAAFTAAYEALNIPSNRSSNGLESTSSSSTRSKSEINAMEISYMSACQQGKIKIDVASGDGGDVLEGSSSSSRSTSNTLVVELFSTASTKIKRKGDKTTPVLASSDGFSKTPAVTAIIKM